MLPLYHTILSAVADTSLDVPVLVRYTVVGGPPQIPAWTATVVLPGLNAVPGWTDDDVIAAYNAVIVLNPGDVVQWHPAGSSDVEADPLAPTLVADPATAVQLAVPAVALLQVQKVLPTPTV